MRRFILIGFIIFGWLGCKDSRSQTQRDNIDEFYTRFYDWDYSRIPLIKPFELVCMFDTSYRIKLAEHITKSVWIGNHLISELGPIDKFNVCGTYIFGHKQAVQDHDPAFSTPERWFIINTRLKEIDLYRCEGKFRLALENHQLPDTLLAVNDVYNQARKNRILPWYPKDIQDKIRSLPPEKESLPEIILRKMVHACDRLYKWLKNNN